MRHQGVIFDDRAKFFFSQFANLFSFLSLRKKIGFLLANRQIFLCFCSNFDVQCLGHSFTTEIKKKNSAITQCYLTPDYM